jgi:hypothetical protein
MISYSRSIHRHVTRRIAVLVAVAAITLPALAWKAATIAVARISLSPAEVTTGGTSTATVTLDSPPSFGGATVQLTSGNTSLATVPASVSISGTKTLSKSFTVQTVNGATGCTSISARVGTTQSRSALLVVNPPAPSGMVRVRMNSTGVVGGQSVTGTVTLIGAPLGTVTVQLNSNNPIATVPASVRVTVTQNEVVSVGQATFSVATAPTGNTICPTITATLGVNRGRALLRVVSISG